MGNRGVLITPFRTMIPRCPDTTVADIDGHGAQSSSAPAALVG
jgi:hypothetical protein